MKPISGYGVPLSLDAPSPGSCLIRGIGEDEGVTTTQPTAPPTVNHTAIRLARTPGDMLKAVLVLLVPVAILFGIYVYFFGGNNVITIDPSGTYAEARVSAHFTVLQPAGLSSSWKPVSSAYTVGTPSTLRVGYVAPGGAGFQLVESDSPADTLIQTELGSVNPLARSVEINGRSWGVINATKRSDLALVSTEQTRTVIIMGQASQQQLQQFAAALR
jgi:hypothetical protein